MKKRGYSLEKFKRNSLILGGGSLVILMFMGLWEIVGAFIILSVFWIGAAFE